MKWKRIQALFLAVIMIFTMTANMTPAFAVDSDRIQVFVRIIQNILIAAIMKDRADRHVTMCTMLIVNM